MLTGPVQDPTNTLSVPLAEALTLVFDPDRYPINTLSVPEEFCLPEHNPINVFFVPVVLLKPEHNPINAVSYTHLTLPTNREV
mgnify:CR=1 FL=1